MTARKPGEDRKIVHGTANIFADLGFPDPETHLLKAQLVTKIRHLLKAAKMTQVQAAKTIGVSQPDISRILRGEFRECSVERLMRFLAALGCDVEIVVRPKGESEADRFSVGVATRAA